MLRMLANESSKFAEGLLESLRSRGVRLATVESCTAGGVSFALGRIAGASDVLWGAFVVYDNSAKTALGVSPQILHTHGAVSRETAIALAQAGLAKIPGDKGFCIATTGVAGPTGGSPEKPVGTCWLAIAGLGREKAILIQEPPRLSRAKLQDRFVTRALLEALKFIAAS